MTRRWWGNPEGGCIPQPRVAVLGYPGVTWLAEDEPVIFNLEEVWESLPGGPNAASIRGWIRPARKRSDSDATV